MKCFKCKRELPIEELRFRRFRKRKHHVCPLCSEKVRSKNLFRGDRK